MREKELFDLSGFSGDWGEVPSFSNMTLVSARLKAGSYAVPKQPGAGFLHLTRCYNYTTYTIIHAPFNHLLSSPLLNESSSLAIIL